MNKILIVDGSATMRKIILRMLVQADFQADTILQASNGVEGLQKLLSNPEIRLILSDINMPEMNGVDFVRAVRAKHDSSNLPMVMITTEGSEAMVKTALDWGANGYITRPFTVDGIREQLTKVMGSREDQGSKLKRPPSGPGRPSGRTQEGHWLATGEVGNLP